MLVAANPNGHRRGNPAHPLPIRYLRVHGRYARRKLLRYTSARTEFTEAARISRAPNSIERLYMRLSAPPKSRRSRCDRPSTCRRPLQARGLRIAPPMRTAAALILTSERQACTHGVPLRRVHAAARSSARGRRTSQVRLGLLQHRHLAFCSPASLCRRSLMLARIDTHTHKHTRTHASMRLVPFMDTVTAARTCALCNLCPRAFVKEWTA